MVVDQIIAGILASGISQNKSNLFWMSILIISFSVPLAIYGFIISGETILLFLSIGLLIGFTLMWAIAIFIDSKRLSFEKETLEEQKKSRKEFFSYIEKGFLVWLADKKYLPKSVGKMIGDKIINDMINRGILESYISKKSTSTKRKLKKK